MNKYKKDWIVWANLRRRTWREKIGMSQPARVELARVMEHIIEEAIVRVRMEGRNKITEKDIRRCPACQQDRSMGALKL